MGKLFLSEPQDVAQKAQRTLVESPTLCPPIPTLPSEQMKAETWNEFLTLENQNVCLGSSQTGRGGLERSRAFVWPVSSQGLPGNSAASPTI